MAHTTRNICCVTLHSDTYLTQLVTLSHLCFCHVHPHYAFGARCARHRVPLGALPPPVHYPPLLSLRRACAHDSCDLHTRCHANAQDKCLRHSPTFAFVMCTRNTLRTTRSVSGALSTTGALSTAALPASFFVSMTHTTFNILCVTLTHKTHTSHNL